MKFRPSFLRFYATLLAALIVFSLRDSFGQSLGELARQERARKLARQPRVTKVYTNEDLQREVIINPTTTGAQEESALAEALPAETPMHPVPVYLTFAPTAVRSKEIVPPASAQERAVPTVPVWPAGMALGDIARYYRQQIAPQIPADDSRLQQALAQQPQAQPMLRDYAADKLQLTLAPNTISSTESLPTAVTAPRATREMDLPAPFVAANVEGSSVPVIENVAEQELPAFPSPAVKLALTSNATSTEPHTEPRQSLRFEAPDFSEVVLSFDSASASLGIPTIGGAEFSAPAYDLSQELSTIRFAAPQPTAAPAASRSPIKRTAEPVGELNLRAVISSTALLESVSPWRYADQVMTVPAPTFATQSEAARTVVASTSEESAPGAASVIEREVRVQRGDSLWLLALRHLGDGHAWPEIAAANPQLANPNHIVAGQFLRVPVGRVPAASAEAVVQGSQPSAVASAAGKSVTVRQGDSLWKLAETALGKGAAWGCIADANPQITDANRIFAGQTLVLPSDCNSRS